MKAQNAPHDPGPETQTLRQARFAARAALLWEQLWPALLPLLAVVTAFLAISWLGLWPVFSETARWVTLAALALAGLAALWPLAMIRMPEPAAVDRRIEQRSALADRPVTAQTDPLSTATPDDPLAAALWREHRRRMAGRLDRLSAGVPQPALARRDPYALRALVPLILFIAAVAGYGQYGPRIGDAFRNHAVAEAIAGGRIDAWVTPPAYTNRPPLYLDMTSGARFTNRVPEGSVLVVRALDVETPALVRDEDGLSRDIAPKDGAVPVFETVPVAGQPLTLRTGTTHIATFAFTITPDTTPTIAFEDMPKASTRGALEFSYRVSDDYGVASAEATITPLDVTGDTARPLVEPPALPLSLPRRRARDGSAKTSRDLTAHPWAGGRVEMVLSATDDAGQQGQSKPHAFTLPERVFTDPLAKALVFERRRLAQNRNNRRSVARMLDVISDTHPEALIPDPAHYMALRVIYRMVARNTAEEPLREALDLMWTTALAIEDGDLSAAERRLREAQERLSEALENGASEEAIDKLMAELREAMGDFMREMAEQMARQSENRQAMQNPNMQLLRKQDLDAMMQRIEDLAKSGSRDAARELLQEMQRMMNNLQTARPQNRQQQQSPMGEQMNKLGEMMREQQQLMDRTFDLQRQQGRQAEQGQQSGEQQPPNGEQLTEEQLADAMRQLQQQQGALQQQMESMQQALRGMGMEPGEGLGQAGEAMGGAERQLGKGRAGEATGEQNRALQAMREGAQQMIEQMQQQGQANGQNGQDGQSGQTGRPQQAGQGRDPLGRDRRNRGQQLGDDIKIPGEIDAQRARKILEDIRRRLGDVNRPKLELDYLDRLLPSR